MEAGLEKRHRRIVIDGVGVQRPDDADVVGDLCGVRQQFAEPRAGLRRAASNLKIDGAVGNFVWYAVMPVSRWPLRIESGSSVPRSFARFGL